MPEVIVDTYCVDVDTPELDTGRHEAILSAEERGRAGQFHFERDRRRYIARRGILRELIGSYLDCDPAAVAFVHNAYGKPAIERGDLCFNLSHSHGMALYAFCRHAEVGCDIERRDPKFAAEQIPERFFSPDEVRTLRSLPLNEQTEAFFNCWTRKEAYIKAVGRGLSIVLDSFDVSLTPGEPAALRRGCEGWSVQSFEPLAGFQAAVVAHGANWRLNFNTAPLLSPRVAATTVQAELA
jgi:4'-phosphopantetheinyl transferase